jgi:L-lactate utilization protein LutC
MSNSDLFKASVESVAGHCVLTTDVADVIRRILAELKAQRVAISEKLIDLDIGNVTVAPSASDIFAFDIGISTAQAAIADTGTLVLDNARERHRLLSLVPPVHIAIVAASTICDTLSDALALLQSGDEISPAVTFITGPSRTADIELTLAIGVHGPQELYVIVDTAN